MAIHFPFTQRCFVPSLLEMAKWFRRQLFLNVAKALLLFHIYPPLGKGLHLKPLHQSMQTLVEIGPVVLEKTTCEKFVNKNQTIDKGKFQSSKCN